MAQCFSVLRGKRVRVTRLDDCCRVPDPGTPCSFAVASCFVSVSYSAEVESGDDLTVKDADGNICVSDRTCDQFRHYNVEVEFAQADPELLSILTGVTLETDFTGETVGWRQAQGAICDAFSLEVWTGIPGADCDPNDPGTSYGYILLPCVSGGLLGDFTIENGVTNFTVTGAYTKSGAGWGIGPYDVVEQDAAATPGPLLTAMQSGEHLLLRKTLIAPPDATCGCQPMPGVLNQLCSVDIDAPAENATHNRANALTLTAIATDPEDGNISANIVWTSSINGTLAGGTGGSRTIPANTLTAGTHILTASVTDSDGRTCTASRTLVVTETPVNAAPTITDVQPPTGHGPIDVDFNASVTATDAEDGNVAGTAQWVSDVDGTIATGSNPTIPGSTMTAGVHNVTITVTDGQGASASQTVVWTIG